MLKATRQHYGSIVIEPSELDEALSESQIPEIWAHICYKTYPRFKQIPLNVNFSEKNGDIFDLIRARETKRDFSATAQLDFGDLSNILYYSTGIKNIREIKEKGLDIHNPEIAKRMYASGGARYPIELYVIANNVSGLEQGLYHYNVRDNTLELLLEDDLRGKKILIDSQKTGMQRNAAALIVMTAVLPRNEVKYLELSYALAFEEAGRVGDRIQLLSGHYSLSCCPIAGFYHDELIGLINIDPEEEIPLMVQAIGKLITT